MQTPGNLTLLGSGETASTGGQVFEMTARTQAQKSAPIRISVLETPAGFEANAQRVAGRVVDFIKTRLQNYKPEVQLISARKKGMPFSPDSAEIVEPLYSSNIIFFGPGSPTYTVRQLENSLAWHVIQARQRMGASLILASAATISIGMLALPVYEIFKAGEDPHWKLGLNFFRPYGMGVVIVPHWNNREGGDEVDTSHCFIGTERFNELRALLKTETTILGIDEHTALTIDFSAETCRVLGNGQVHIQSENETEDYPSGSEFPIYELGNYHPLQTPGTGIPTHIWEKAQEIQARLEHARTGYTHPDLKTSPVPTEVKVLVDARQEARQNKDWARADMIRGKIANLGWVVKDTPAGPVIEENKPSSASDEAE